MTDTGQVRNISSQQPLPGFNQRWRERRTLYRPAGEVIRPSEYDIEVTTEAEAKAFCFDHHYLRRTPPVKVAFALYRRGDLVGVAVFSVPTNYAEYTPIFRPPAGGLLAEKFSKIGYSPKRCADLGRLCLLDSVPGNAESYFVARCLEVLRARGYQGVISFSDPVPRTAIDGYAVSAAPVLCGHAGTVYQSLSYGHFGRGTARTLRLLPDASVFSDRAIQKIRKLEKGWAAAAKLLESFGADAPPIEDEARRDWLARWLSQLTRPLRHPGNFKYALALDRRLRRFMPPPLPYPKLIAAPPNDAAEAA